MKKVIAIVVLILVVLCCAACTNTTSPEPSSTDDQAPSVSENDTDTTSEEIPSDSQSTDQSDNTETAINNVKDELDSKGWKDIEAVAGEPDSAQWGGLVLEPAEVDEDSVLYTIMGQSDGMNDNPITVVIKVVFNDNMPEGERVDLFYVSKAGRVMEVESNEFGQILPADDQSLIDFMYSD